MLQQFSRVSHFTRPDSHCLIHTASVCQFERQPVLLSCNMENSVSQEYAEMQNLVDEEMLPVIEYGLKIVNDTILTVCEYGHDWSEEQRIFVFHAAVANWYKRFTSQAIRDLSVYDFVNHQPGSIMNLRYSQVMLTDWDAWLLTAYFTSVRPAFIHRNSIAPPRVLIFEEFKVITSSFFINSSGSSDFKPSNIVLQFVEKIKSTRITEMPANIRADTELPAIGDLRT